MVDSGWYWWLTGDKQQSIHSGYWGTIRTGWEWFIAVCGLGDCNHHWGSIHIERIHFANINHSSCLFGHDYGGKKAHVTDDIDQEYRALLVLALWIPLIQGAMSCKTKQYKGGRPWGWAAQIFVPAGIPQMNKKPSEDGQDEGVAVAIQRFKALEKRKPFPSHKKNISKKPGSSSYSL